MAYNLESLVQILEQLLDHQQPLWILDPNKKPRIESLLKKACFLKEFFEKSSSAATSYRLQSVESRIRDVAYKAEDVLESHLVDQLLSSPEGESFIFSPPDLDLEKVTGELDSAKEEMMAIMEGREMHLKYRLIGGKSELEVIPIVGMGGIGKTTLARNLYHDPSVISHFDVRIWATISQDYSEGGILNGLLRSVWVGHTFFLLSKKRMVEELYKGLKRRRYLIVLDDIWNKKPWTVLRKCFPDDGTGSRIIVTTRLLEVADYIASGSSYHHMNPLKDDESWKLLHQKVFAPQETCPSELVSIGRNIAENCRGLPLAIDVVGGLLSQAERSQVFWEQVAKDISEAAADNSTAHLFQILLVSYNYLPHHLKPCFLYMGIFKEDSKIRASKLIKLWVAEGFLKPISGKSLEEAAEMYLKALADRNLICVPREEFKGNVKRYSIHDLLRDLCVRKAYEENFLFLKERYIPGDIHSRRVCAHRIQDIDRPWDQMQLTRSFLSMGDVSWEILSPLISAFRLLRVLDILSIRHIQFPGEIIQLVNLRYLALCTSKVPSSISRLWNLQVLIVKAIVYSINRHVVTPEILEMTQLRHIKFKGFSVWYDDQYREHIVVQDQLQSLSTIAVSGLTDRVLRTIPNLKKLGIFCDEKFDHVRDLSRLHKLHSLKCSSWRDADLSNLIFPDSLKELALHDCVIHDPHMSRIGNLPNLQILKFRRCGIKNRKWKVNEGEFCQLKYLIMASLHLDFWAADDICFPRLEHLIIRRCPGLPEIPYGIGDIPTLKVIEVRQYLPPLLDSVRMIQKKQEKNGNDGLEVRLSTTTRLR
ncbi:UNVERIFIED_CONTAM: putative late blight resistance protein R1B-14 [Sesamum indicum]